MSKRSAKQIRVAELVANPANIRRELGDITELARSIQAEGVLNPLLVTEDPQYRGWLLLAGHRRLAACQKAGLLAVPCFVHHDIGGDVVEQTVVMLVENVQRKNLTPVEKARAYGSLRDRGLTPAQIARRTGIAFSTISTHLALLDLDGTTLKAVEDGDIATKDAVGVVREQRRETRRANGSSDRGRPIVLEPPHFSRRHPLAGRVMDLCDHTIRPKLGGNSGKGTGCGQCWEQAIREDAARTTDDRRPTTDDRRPTTDDRRPSPSSTKRPSSAPSTGIVP